MHKVVILTKHKLGFLNAIVNKYLDMFKVENSELYLNIHILMKRLHQNYFNSMLMLSEDVKIITDSEKEIMRQESEENKK
jgi:hypothetical protein